MIQEGLPAASTDLPFSCPPPQWRAGVVSIGGAVRLGRRAAVFVFEEGIRHSIGVSTWGFEIGGTLSLPVTFPGVFDCDWRSS